nr:reverse transcriptase domain-containing protein [Tanacetum cinerariifolium]
MPEPGPESRNHCAVVPNRQGRKIREEERYSKDWKKVCFIATQKAATKVLALKKHKLLSRNIATKKSIREEWKQCQKVKEVQEATESQNQISKSRVLRMTYPNHGVWFDDLPKESIDSYDDLRKAFLENYLQQEKCIKDPVEIHNIKQRDRESTKEFVQ